MIPWNKAPLIRVLIPFVAGIITAAFVDVEVKIFPWLLLFLFILIILFSFMKVKYERHFLHGVTIWLFLFIAAYELTIFNSEKYFPDHFTKHYDNAELALGEIDDAINEKARTVKTIIKVKAIKINDSWQPVTGKALVYFKKDSNALSLNIGDRILFDPAFAEINPPQNPYEFNYKRYLSFHQVYRQLYLAPEKWEKAAGSEASVFALADKCRKKLLSIFKRYGLSGDEYAVSSALLVGYEEDIGEHLIQAYSSTGALHVLSVSGMHVGIIYIFLTYALRFLKKIPQGNILRAVILIVFLWGYAFITGLSPSVQRAAMMFSLIAVGTSFNRYTNIYNTLAASALVLLVIDPFLIMQVGFQLSYLAVIGIVYLQPKIVELWEPESTALNWVWQITAVSIAAQIATFPLGLLYFHQFPNYFLLSNLMVIPLSNIIIYLGIVVFAVSPLEAITRFLTKILHYLVKALNESLLWIEKWPHAIIEGISISIAEAFLIYGIIIFIIAFFAVKRPVFLYLSLCGGIALLLFQNYELAMQQKQNKIIVYNISRATAIELIQTQNVFFIADSSLTNDKNRIRFHLQNSRINHGINNKRLLPGFPSEDFNNPAGIFIKDNFIQFRDKKIAVLDKPLPYKFKPAQRIKLDYLILSKNVKTSIAQATAAFDVKKIIIDSSNSYYKVKRWQAECDSLNRPCHAVSVKGAFVASSE